MFKNRTTLVIFAVCLALLVGGATYLALQSSHGKGEASASHSSSTGGAAAAITASVAAVVASRRRKKKAAEDAVSADDKTDTNA